MFSKKKKKIDGINYIYLTGLSLMNLVNAKNSESKIYLSDK